MTWRLRGGWSECYTYLAMCPVCQQPMVAFELEGVEIDRCPGGCGLWFDDGEMQQFIARFDEGEPGAVARFFADWFGKKDSVEAS